MPDYISPQQAVPGVMQLLQDYSITVEDIALACKLDQETVHDALSVLAFDSCPLFAVASVRRTLRCMLVDRGWKGDDKKLWGEHDIQILFTRR